MKRVLFILLLFFVRDGFTIDTLVLKDDVREYGLKPENFQIYIATPNEKYSATNLDQIPFRDNENRVFQNSDVNKVYWLKLVIDDQSTWNKRYVFEVYDVHTNDFRLYVKDDDGKYIEKKAGGLIKFGDRDDYDVVNFVFDIPNARKAPQVIYVRVRSDDISHFDYYIKTQNFFTSYSTTEYHFLGFYYGILFIMAIYNLLLFITSRERVYMYYVLYVISCVFYSYSDDGLGFQFWWPEHPEWNIPMNYYITPLAFLITFVLYSRNFLELKAQHPRLDKLVLISVGVYLVYLPFEIFVLPPEYHLNQLYSLPFFVVYGASIYVFKNGFKAGRYFIVGYTCVFVSVLILQLRYYDILHAEPGFWSIMLVYSFKIGIVLEILVLSYALGDRIRLLKEEKEKAQQVIIDQLEENKLLQEKVNRELEEKVTERTQQLKFKTDELIVANQKLEDLTNKLNEANAKLDYDNWQLVKEVKKEKEARLLSRELNYEEFMKIFSDDRSCFKFLEQLKWPDEFKCRKCGNQKYLKRSKLHSRKCTKCNHIESVMADTIFQGVKFPLAKAFYITYLTCQRGSSSTVNELAELLGLARNTCWKFRKKVQDRIEEIKLKDSKVDVTNWENLILFR